MKGTVTEKIIKAHLREGDLQRDREIGIRIDQTLTQDATGTMAYLQFEAIGVPRVKTELSVSYIDHNTLQTDFRNMDDHRFLQSIARKFGLYFSRAGNGICHQVHLERFGIPGKTLIGSDSHTPTAGGLGMLAIGAGGLDVAVAMAGGLFYIPVPEVIGVELTGSLNPFCSAKDVILTLLQKETVKGGVGKIYEYFGPGTKSLSVYQRATITNMGAELGATTSIFPSDEITKAFLAVQKRENQWVFLEAEKRAAYSRIIKIDLSTVEPMVALPHMPDKVVHVREVEGKPVQQIVIGSCTNSSINDLGITADILKGKTIPKDLSLGIAPGSRQVILASFKAGIIQSLVESGARILESACGPCIGMGFAPGNDSVSLRTFNRNFKGRTGSEGAEVYLVSPEIAAASAATGVITDPRKFKNLAIKDYSSFLQPEDSMILPPDYSKEAAESEIVRGPNIKPIPKGEALPDSLSLPVLIKTGDNITTDDIMPAGAKILPLRSNIPEISRFVFEKLDPGFAKRALDKGKGAILGGENYGQGSSREHAALAPMFLGVKVVLAKSFARIHKANLINFGILPLIFKNPADYDLLEEGDTLEFANLRESLETEKGMKVSIKNKKRSLRVLWDLDPRSIRILLSGGLLSYTKRESANAG